MWEGYAFAIGEIEPLPNDELFGTVVKFRSDSFTRKHIDLCATTFSQLFEITGLLRDNKKSNRVIYKATFAKYIRNVVKNGTDT